MTDTIDIRVPDIGDFDDVEVIEVLVAAGDTVEVEDGIITLETDKASMDVPASDPGTIVSVEVKVGDKLNTGDVVAIAESASEPAAQGTPDETGEAPVIGDEEDTVSTRIMSDAEIVAATGSPDARGPRAADASGTATHSAQLVVVGAGPGGYTAAFRAADLGLDVILIERYPSLGGVCLNVGCIPSKALLHAAKVIDEARDMAEHGVVFGEPEIDAAKLRDWKSSVVSRLTGGLTQLAKQRKVRVLTATAVFESPNRLALDNGETVDFEKCIIAAGSQPMMLPNLPDDPRIVDSTGALELHPFQGAAARSEGHRRSPGYGRTRRGFRRAGDRCREAP